MYQSVCIPMAHLLSYIKLWSISASDGSLIFSIFFSIFILKAHYDKIGGFLGDMGSVKFA